MVSVVNPWMTEEKLSKKDEDIRFNLKLTVLLEIYCS